LKKEIARERLPVKQVSVPLCRHYFLSLISRDYTLWKFCDVFRHALFESLFRFDANAANDGNISVVLFSLVYFFGFLFGVVFWKKIK
jgi:hypothetical protein